MDARYHICRDLRMSGKVKLEYCPIIEMIADMLTKLSDLQWFSNRGKVILSMPHWPLMTITGDFQFVKVECWTRDILSILCRMATQGH